MKKYGFIGAGKMAGAIVKGLLKGAAKPEDIVCACGNDDTGKNLALQTGIKCAASAAEVIGGAEIIVLACKPQQLAEAAKAAAGAKNRLLLSILAGTPISRLRECFADVAKIVRVMPNMPAQISQGISCYAPETPLTAEEKRDAETILSAIGEFMQVEESRLDAVTALSGSGPGYLFEFAAALIEGAQKIGFSREEAVRLVNKTLLGSAMLLAQSPLTADELCAAVSSPGGTTLAGLAEMQKAGFRKTVENVLKSSKKRSEELSKL